MIFPQCYKQQLLRAIETVNLDRVAEAIEWFRQARDEGRQVFVCGNGGSATTASHFVTEMLKSTNFGSAPRFRILALTESMSTLTAYSNDVGYEVVFVEQLKNFACPGDLVMALSGSGNSETVVRAIEYANSIGCRTLALTGRDGGRMGPLAQLNIHVHEPHMGRIEDAHLMVCHMICYYFMDNGDGAPPPVAR